MIVCSAKVENPQETRLTISVTMPFQDWHRTLDMLRNVPAEHAKHPLSPLKSAIQKAMQVAEGRVTETVEGLGE